LNYFHVYFIGFCEDESCFSCFHPSRRRLKIFYFYPLAVGDKTESFILNFVVFVFIIREKICAKFIHKNREWKFLKWNFSENFSMNDNQNQNQWWNSLSRRFNLLLYTTRFHWFKSWMNSHSSLMIPTRHWYCFLIRFAFITKWE
jgi:hypothetical protein